MFAKFFPNHRIGPPGIWPIARYTLIETVRGRLALSIGTACLLGFAVTLFLGEMAITDSMRIQASALAAFDRSAAGVLVISFVISGLAREHADKGLEVLLSKAIPRSSYVLGKLLGYTLMSALVALFFGLPLMAYAPVNNVIAWAISLNLELIILVGTSLAFGLVVVQPALSMLIVLAFYLLCRVISSILAIVASPFGPTDSLGFGIMRLAIEGIAHLLPNLDHFASSSWLWQSAGVWQQLPGILVQSVVYLALLTGVALFDFYRKNI